MDTILEERRAIIDANIIGTILDQVPLRKLSNLDQLSGLILPLASTDLDYMIGSTITVNGGYTL
jgi:hypothetical protein